MCHVWLPLVPWSRLYFNASLRVGETKPVRSYELLWPAKLPGKTYSVKIVYA